MSGEETAPKEISTDAQQQYDKFWYTSAWFLTSIAAIPTYYALSYLWYYFFEKP